MKSLRLFCLVALAPLWFASTTLAQSPAITSVTVKDTACTYKVGISTSQCSIAPGMTLIVRGSNFGSADGGITLCDCPSTTIVRWASTRVIVIVNSVTPNASLALETMGGGFSNAIPYTPLGPVITSIVVGNCTYIPNQTPTLCLITPGTQVTINGSYFGPMSPYSEVTTCDCAGVLAQREMEKRRSPLV
ncbi:MAG: hypothetical protein ABR861_14655 [Terriglobales bacterium]|jgi:hypothetical protein